MDRITETIFNRIQPVAPRTFAALAEGARECRKSLSKLDPAAHPHVWALTTRAFARESLSAMPLPDGWVVGGNPRLMEQLFLRDEVTGLRMRVLKEVRSVPGGVPAGSGSNTRKQSWTSPPLQQILPGMPSSEGLRGKTDLSDVELLLLFAAHYGAGEPGHSLRAVHPLEPGVFGRRVPIDLDIHIPPGGDIQLSDVREAFVGQEAEVDLYAEIDPAERAQGE